MFGDNTIELGEIGVSELARFFQDLIVMTDSDFTEELSHWRIGNCGVSGTHGGARDLAR